MPPYKCNICITPHLGLLNKKFKQMCYLILIISDNSKKSVLKYISFILLSSIVLFTEILHRTTLSIVQICLLWAWCCSVWKLFIIIYCIWMYYIINLCTISSNDCICLVTIFFDLFFCCSGY